MWVFEQQNGRISRNNATLEMAYSGHPPHVNDPAAQEIPNVGPLPCGYYDMVGIEDSPNTGPFTIVLKPHPENEMFGRSEMRIHGDSVEHPGQHVASDGCIVASKPARLTMYLGTNDGVDHLLQVVKTLETEDSVWPNAPGPAASNP